MKFQRHGKSHRSWPGHKRAALPDGHNDWAAGGETGVGMSNWLGIIEGLVAGAAPMVGLIYPYLANKRSQYDRVLALTAESGLPPVAEDRHVAGMVFEPLSRHPPGQPVRLGEAEIKAVF